MTNVVWLCCFSSSRNLVGTALQNETAHYHRHRARIRRAATAASGAVIERYDYDVFGALRNTLSGASNDWRFTGEQFDSETGNVFLRARYYDPVLGRFTGVDPIRGAAGSPQTLNQYAYALNNPGTRADPSGLLSIKCPGGSSSCDSPALADIPGITSPLRRSRGRRNSETAQQFVPQSSTPPTNPCPRRTGRGVVVERDTWLYRVRLPGGIEFKVIEHMQWAGLGDPAAKVWDWRTIWARARLPFGSSLYHHEVGHILQQDQYGLDLYKAYAVQAYVLALGSHDNWFEREANCLAGFPGHEPPGDQGD